MSEKAVDDVILSDFTYYGNAHPSLTGLTNNYYYEAKGKGNYLNICRKLKQIEENRQLRCTRFPSLKGTVDFPQKHSVARRVKWNDEVASQPSASRDNVSDPASRFVTASADVGSASAVNFVKTSQPVTARAETVQQKKQVAGGGLTRLNTWTPGAPTAWNSRKTLDIWIRSKLGGWTSDADPRKSKDTWAKPQTTSMKDQTQSIQDQLALKYIYNSSTQRGYEDVPWDSILQPKRWPPALTVEEKPDAVLYQRNYTNFNPEIQDQEVGKLYTQGTSRHLQGQMKSENCASLDHQLQMSPLYRQCSHIGTSGARITSPSETYVRTSSAVQNDDQTQSDPLEKPTFDHRRKSRMSKMVTLVPPHNPFNSIEKPLVHI